jgi:hypothetical protein
MKLDVLAVALLLFSSAPFFAHAQPYNIQIVSNDATAFDPRDENFITDAEELWNRKGAGGGGGKDGSCQSSGQASSSSSGYESPSAIFASSARDAHVQETSNNLTAPARLCSQDKAGGKDPRPLPPNRALVFSQRVRGNTMAEEPPLTPHPTIVPATASRTSTAPSS